MRRLVIGPCVLASALMLSLPAGAIAAPAPATSPVLPYIAVPSLDVRPPGFATDGREALLAAEHAPAMVALHRREHPLDYLVKTWGDDHWAIQFTHGGVLVAEVDLGRSGRVQRVWTGPQASAVYARGHYAPIFDSPWVVVTFALLFLVPFVDPRRPLLLLDALALLSFLVSYALFDHARLQAAVWWAYPPLLYLLGRGLWLGLHRARTSGRPAWSGTPARSSFRLPLRVLGAGLLALVGARVGLILAGHIVDVGFSSALGAQHILHGHAPHYASATHPDTYGPIAYLAYVPFELVFGFSGHWDALPAVRAATITFDLLTVLGLVVLGRRLRAGRAGWRLGLMLGWAWCAYPFTLLTVMRNANDGIIALLMVWMLVVSAAPVRRGVLLGLATAAKFTPAILLPLLVGGRDAAGRRARVACALGFAAVMVASFAPFIPPGGVSELYHHTIGWQIGRPDVFSPWALHPSLAWLQTALEVGGIVLALGLGLRHSVSDTSRLAALAGALMIAVQLPAEHWFYFYIVWFAPLLLVAVLARADDESQPQAHERQAVHDPAPAVARGPAVTA